MQLEKSGNPGREIESRQGILGIFREKGKKTQMSQWEVVSHHQSWKHIAPLKSSVNLYRRSIIYIWHKLFRLRSSELQR
jgi:hypothetical protein